MATSRRLRMTRTTSALAGTAVLAAALVTVASALPASATRACLPELWGWFADGGVMSRAAVLTDAQWQLIEPLMPSSDGKQGNQFRDHRQVVEGIIYRFRSGLAWRDLPGEFGPWQTVWKRHRRFSADGTWDRIHTALLTHADAIGEIDWNVSIDSTVNRAHQHGTTLSREPSTGGMVESQEFSRGAA